MPDEERPRKSFLVWVIILVLVIVGAVVVYLVVSNKEETIKTNTTTSASTNTNVAVNTNTNSAVDLAQYDGKVINISSTDAKVTGQVAFVYRAGEDMPLTAVTFIKVTDDLPKSRAASGGGDFYHYIASHAALADIRVGGGTGVLSAAFCNTDDMPDVLALARTKIAYVTTYNGCATQYEVGASTRTFYHVYSSYYNQYTFDYQKILALDTFAVFDSAPFYKVIDEESGLMNADPAEVIRDGAIFKQYLLTYAE